MANATPAVEANKTERIMAMLRTPEGRAMSNAAVAEAQGVNEGTVRRARARLAETPECLDISALDLDAGTQMRPGNDPGHEVELAERMESGVELDPIGVVRTPDGRLIVWDGFHRVGAALRLDRETIAAVVTAGSEADAIRLAASEANVRSSLPRCARTQRNAVIALLGLPEFADASASALARAACVSKTTASEAWKDYHARKAREAKSSGAEYAPPSTLKGADGRSRPAPRVAREPGEDDDDPAAPAARRQPSGMDGSTAAPATDPSREREEADEAFLASCFREGRPPLRERLAGERRRAFEREALNYREIVQSPEYRAFKALVNRVTGDRKVGGAEGPFSQLASRSARLDAAHPRDWTPCYTCKGWGVVDGRQCSKCVNGLGFAVN